MSFSLAGPNGSDGGIDTESSPSGVPWCTTSTTWSRRRLGPLGERRDRVQVGADAQPDGRRRGAGAAGQHLRHPREDVAGVVGLTDAAGEGRQDLVGRGALSVHDTIGDPARAFPRGWNASARTAAATNERVASWPPISAPTPLTTAAYTTVMNTASRPNTTVLRTTTSRS